MFVNLNIGRLIEPISGRSWTQDIIHHEIAKRIARFQKFGLMQGHRVFLLFGNRIEFLAELIAIWRLGACAIPVDARLTDFEIKTLMATALPHIAVVDDDVDDNIVKTLNASDVSVFNTNDYEENEASACLSQLDDDALILFTSGSTGAPKGVVHTHRSLRARWTALREQLGTDVFARTLCMLPTHFGHGLICNSLFPWLSGQDLFITPPFRPDIIMKLGNLIDEHQITFMSSVPSIWTLALKLSKPPSTSSLQRVHCGSAPLSSHMLENIRQWAGTQQVYNVYGITETGSWVAGLNSVMNDTNDGCVGQGWGSVIKILRTNNTATPLESSMECAVGESGFIWLNTPALMKGYFQRDDLTTKAVVDGWFLTGDIGFLDKNNQLVLRGRERDEINKGGMKIYPTDIDAIVERFTHARDVCTFALDNAIYGQTVAIAVVLTQQDDATIRELHQWMQIHLAEPKMPQNWWIVSDIPRTSRGKVNRDQVKAFCITQPPLDLVNVLNRATS